ncbi:enoyl-CoA hydratase/isomerase family protein [Chloroflexota bacterium]
MAIDYSRYQHIKVELQEAIAIITLNRPEALNAINQRMHWELSVVFEDIARDKRVKVVLLTGAGKAFCAGGDIKWFQTTADNPQALRDLMTEASKIINDILDLEVPIIAAVNGDAIGLGATLALFCDIVIASEKSRLADPHVKMGLVAGDGGAVIWPLLVGIHRAKELLMTGNMLDARQAERIGLVSRAVAPESVLATSLDLAKRFSEGPSLAINSTKMSINKRLREDVNLILDYSLAREEQTFHSKDHSEAVRAFVEKRKPKFQGQ